MCEIYASTPPAEYEQITRSIRINGAVTSIRIERRFWNILDELAEEEQTSTGKFISTLHNEAYSLNGEISNFASLLRVVCTTYLVNKSA
ncbi:ribbon-helix-helix domain-containing protein [Maridesulfovibrio sp.]|uniref:ribbon-helix-helix domain-containing protein n=1 Tax=Maridesulfovibrio sp. TaxID=2795000 RepID=UPI002A18A6CE|nr:ribbon-helix-helix domain-containing protein [Maridesulfovibrio sp.]